ncbi:MAG: hypothetical protein Q9205_004716 [Flavoplaca limonia]
MARAYDSKGDAQKRKGPRLERAIAIFMGTQERPILLQDQKIQLPNKSFLLMTWDAVVKIVDGHKPSEEILEIATGKKCKINALASD